MIKYQNFNTLQHTITGWPGGKPHADDTYRPERAKPAVKRVIIFSPHPDDDVISMGGTFDRLIEQGHDVHVAYQTSGSNAVTDQDALKYLEVQQYLNPSEQNKQLIQFLKNKSRNVEDTREIKQLKAFIRRSEALAAVRSLGLDEKKVYFLDLPFYDNSVLKREIGERDIQIMQDFITNIKPHQIFAAGDLADPHGTHRLTFELLKKVLKNIKGEKLQGYKRTIL